MSLILCSWYRFVSLYKRKVLLGLIFDQPLVTLKTDRSISCFQRLFSWYIFYLILGITPGYGDEVIFADGTFTDGSTLELSADGPLREPFVAFTQGAIHWSHWALVLEEVLRRPEYMKSWNLLDYCYCWHVSYFSGGRKASKLQVRYW